MFARSGMFACFGKHSPGLPGDFIRVSSCGKDPGLGGITDSRGPESRLSEHPGVRCPAPEQLWGGGAGDPASGSWVGAQCVNSVSSLAWALRVACGSGPGNHCPPRFPPSPIDFPITPSDRKQGVWYLAFLLSSHGFLF